jgi:hypothetical protein
MLSGLALVALLAEPNAARSPTVTTEVTSGEPPVRSSRWGTLMSWLRARPEAALGGFASTLSLSFVHGPLRLGMEVPSLSLPDWVPGAQTANGWLVPRLAHGLYLGHAPAPRPKLLPLPAGLVTAPVPLLPGPHVRMDGTVFLTSRLGVRIEVGVGHAMFTGVSLIYRPDW